MEKPISNRTNGKCGGLVSKRFSFGNTEFEALAHENLTPQRIVDNNTGRHIKGRDIILGDSFRMLYSELEKGININSNAFSP